jgi:hypothetical protein
MTVRIINNLLQKNYHQITHTSSITTFKQYTNYKIIIKSNEKINLKINDDNHILLNKEYDSKYIIDYFYTMENINIKIICNGEYNIQQSDDYRVLHHLILLSNYFDNNKELYNQSNIISTYYNKINIEGYYSYYIINDYRKINNIGIKLQGNLQIKTKPICNLFYYIGQNGCLQTQNKLTHSNKIITSIVDNSDHYTITTDTTCYIQKLCNFPIGINQYTIEHEFNYNTVNDVITIIAFTERYEIMEKNINILRNQTKQCNIILVGSTDEDIEFCKKMNVNYVKCNNKPLGLKWQVGVYYAKLFNPESIMILGSDDLISKDYIKIGYNHIKSGYDMVGIRSWYLNDNNKIYKIEYTDKVKITLGSGRMYSSRILDKINWELFELFIDKGLDDHGYNMVKNNNGKYLDNIKDGYLTSIKGDWEMINTLETFKQYEKSGYITINQFW